MLWYHPPNHDDRERLAQLRVAEAVLALGNAFATDAADAALVGELKAADGRKMKTLTRADFPLPTLGAVLAAVDQEIEQGRGAFSSGCTPSFSDARPRFRTAPWASRGTVG